MKKISKMAGWNGKNSRCPLMYCHISGGYCTSYNDIVKATDNKDYAVMNDQRRVIHLFDNI
jgi:hypothetical protein